MKAPPDARKKEKPSAIVRHCDLWGAQRQVKYDWLDEHQVKDTEWTTLEPAAPHYLFIPQNTRRLKEYERGWKITEIMPIHSLGIAAGRDHFTVGFSRKELRNKIQTFLELESEEARRRFDLGPDSRDWQVKLAQAELKRCNWDSCVTTILYRPFDHRQTCYTGVSRGFHCMARQGVMRHFLQANANLGLSTTRSVEIRGGWTHVLATDEITQLHSVSLKEVNYLFPLYLYPNGKLPEARFVRARQWPPPELERRVHPGFLREAEGQVRAGRPGPPRQTRGRAGIDFPLRLRRIPQPHLSRALRGVPARGFPASAPHP